MTLPRHLVYHVDRAFQDARAAWLDEAAFRLEQDTHGRLQVEYRYDLDFDGRIQRFPENEWLLVDLPEDSRITEHFDDKHKSKILGECDASYRVVYLVTERVTLHDKFVHVAMHETLHAVGLDHIDLDSNAIMFPYVKSELPLHMTEADLDAFCRVLKCSVKGVQP